MDDVGSTCLGVSVKNTQANYRAKNTEKLEFNRVVLDVIHALITYTVLHGTLQMHTSLTGISSRFDL